MFDILGPIGAIQSPKGHLKFGHVAMSNCVYLSYESEADSVPTLIYTPEELADLIAIVEVALGAIDTLSPGSSLRIGSMKAKPMVLSLALVSPPAQSPFLLLRMWQGNWTQDITTSPEDLLALLKMGRVEGPEPLVGPLERNKDGSWSIGGEQLEILQGLSPGQGYFGEYLHPDEVKTGQVLELWPFSHEGRKFVASFRLKERHRPVDSGDDNPGAKADRYLARGQNHLARAEVLQLAQKLLASGKVPAPWAAKASLTHLLADLADRDQTSGQKVWLGQSENKILRLGIDFMEAGQTSLHDLLIYQQISAYFHSLNPDISSAKTGVNGLMSKVCEECAKSAPALSRIALCNWYLYLKEIYEAEPPPEALVEWKKAVESSGLRVKPKVISFPNPDSWELEEASLTSHAPTADSAPPPSDLWSKHKPAALAVMIIIVFSFAMLKLIALPDSTSSGAPSLAQFEGNPALSIAGVSLAQSWQEIDELRDWEDRQNTILATYLPNGWLNVRFDADKSLKYIEGPELSRGSSVIFPYGTSKNDILSRWGVPSETKARELIYIYEDGGVKCALSLVFMEDSLDRVRLSTAGQRWENAPALPILER